MDFAYILRFFINLFNDEMSSPWDVTPKLKWSGT